jgi:hypothetical protein
MHVLMRWEASGGRWRVLEERDGWLTVGLYPLDGGEVVTQVTGARTSVLETYLARSAQDEIARSSGGPGVAALRSAEAVAEDTTSLGVVEGRPCPSTPSVSSREAVAPVHPAGDGDYDVHGR